MRLLLVEDDRMLGASVQRGLKLEGQLLSQGKVTRGLVAGAGKQVALLVQRGEQRLYVPVDLG